MQVFPMAPSVRRLVSLAASHSTRLPAVIFPTRGQSTSCSTPGVYELRTYNIAAKDFGEFLRLTSEKFDLRTAHSAPLGYWATELGGLNQVVHIWYYASLQHRASIRQALSQDADWCGQYLTKILPALQQQDNSLLLPLPGVPVHTSSTATGAYELHEVDMAAPSGEWLHALQDYTNLMSVDQGCVPFEGRPALLGAWKTVVGRLDRVVLLCQHASMDDAVCADSDLENKREQLTRFTRHWSTKQLKPHPVSPLQ